VALLLEGLKALTKGDDGQTPIRDRWAVLAAVVMGLVLAACAGVIAGDVTFEAWLERVLQGLLAGFGACGVFSVAKRRSQ